MRFVLPPRPGLVGRACATGLGRLVLGGGPLAVDIEATGLDPWGRRGVDRQYAPARPFMISFADTFGNTGLASFQIDPLTREVVGHPFSPVQALLNRPHLVFHNAPYDVRVLRLTGYKIDPKVIHDTQLRQHVINSGEFDFRLKSLAKQYLGMGNEDEIALHAATIKARLLGKKAGWALAEDVEADYWMADWDLCAKYATLDAERTIRLYLVQEEYFRDAG